MSVGGRSQSLGVMLLAAGCWTAPNPAYSDHAPEGTGVVGDSTGNPVVTTAEPPPGESSGEPEETAEGTTTGPPPTGDCPEGRTCENIPDGWIPVLRPTANDAAQCPEGTIAGEIFEVEPVYECECDCGPAGDPCTLAWQLNARACDLPLLDQSGCGNTSGPLFDGNYYADMQAPGCMPNDALLEVEVSSPQPVCELGDMAARCGEGTWCAPQGGGCVLAAGRLDCPAGFGQRKVMASSWTAPDCSVECGGCAFGCPEEVVLWTSAGCVGGGGVVVAADATCTVAPENINYYSMSFDQVPTCLTAENIGVDATATDEHTLCCR